MTPDEHRMLEEAVMLSKENAEALKGIQRSLRISTGLKIVYWVIILGITFGAFYAIQPYINALTGSMSNLQENPVEGAERVTANGLLKSVRDLKELIQ